MGGGGLGGEGRVGPGIGMWIADGVLVLAGLALLPRMEQFRGEDRWLKSLGRVKIWLRLVRARTARTRAAAARIANGTKTHRGTAAPSGGSLPLLMDLYLLRRFFSYFAMLMLVFVFLFEPFTFFELLDHIAPHPIAFIQVADYFWFLTPYLTYQLAPLAALVAIL